jgi:hypothetical protein
MDLKGKEPLKMHFFFWGWGRQWHSRAKEAAVAVFGMVIIAVVCGLGGTDDILPSMMQACPLPSLIGNSPPANEPWRAAALQQPRKTHEQEEEKEQSTSR